ncbi:hypothetical protein [Leeia sp.]|uniref:hypothetical protein n=1 Tax=Leeia sp. TaxID=2884678 RepID=UPI0035B1E4DA
MKGYHSHWASFVSRQVLETDELKAIARLLCLAILTPLANACFASPPALSEADIVKGCMNPEMESRAFLVFGARVLDVKADGMMVLARSDNGKKVLIKLAGITVRPSAFDRAAVISRFEGKTVDVLVDPQQRDQEQLIGTLNVSGQDLGEWLLQNSMADFTALDAKHLSSYSACRYHNIAAAGSPR